MVAKVEQSDEWQAMLAQEEFRDGGTDVAEPETFVHEGEIIGRPSEGAVAPMQVSGLAFKGHVELWRVKTGQRVLQPKWLLWQTMEKKHADGTKVFTFKNPHIEPDYGEALFCPLNPDSPDYHRISGMGLPKCTKKNIPHQDAVNNHTMKSHKRGWAALEREEADRIRKEDRDLQQDMLKALTGAAVRGVETSTPREVVSASVEAKFTSTCALCDKSFTGKTQKMSANNLRLHNRHCK